MNAILSSITNIASTHPIACASLCIATTAIGTAFGGRIIRCATSVGRTCFRGLRSFIRNTLNDVGREMNRNMQRANERRRHPVRTANTYFNAMASGDWQTAVECGTALNW